MGFWSFSRFNFRGWALRQSHTPNFTNPDAIKPRPLVLHVHSKSSENGMKYELYWADLTISELRCCVVEAMICGYHDYQSIWEAEVGENLTCVREPSNVRDPYAVAVTKPESSTIVGHIPRNMSAICSVKNFRGIKISRFHPDPRKQRKLIPSKISRYTVVPDCDYDFSLLNACTFSCRWTKQSMTRSWVGSMTAPMIASALTKLSQIMRWAVNSRVNL